MAQFTALRVTKPADRLVCARPAPARVRAEVNARTSGTPPALDPQPRSLRPSMIPVRLSQPGDQSERAADSAADAVMKGMPWPMVAPGGGPVIARCAGGCSPVSCHDRATAQAASPDLLKTAPAGPVRSALAEPGQPLPAPVRQRMQTGFGTDFSSVRVHDGPIADSAARLAGARAFTLANHVVFAAGEYQPASAQGQRLLAHELAHVVQQGLAGPAAEAAPGSLANTVRSSLAPEPAGMYRAVATGCLAPSEVPSVTENNASRLGSILEVPIMARYCAETGGSPFITDYFDVGGAGQYIGFLGTHNPHLSAADLVELALAATVLGGLFRPDILTHRPPDSSTRRSSPTR